jgi:AraC family transcriptional regulator, transcriptional activator of pobA
MKNKLYFKGLYDEHAIEFVEGLVHVYPFPVVRGKFVENVKLHAHNDLLQVFIIENGTTEVLLDEGIHKVVAPAFFTMPKNIAHGFHSHPDVKGWIISLSDSFLENLLHQEADILVEIDTMHFAQLTSDKQAIQQVYKTMLQCVEEYRSNRAGKHLVLKSLVSLMLVQLYRLSADTVKLLPSPNNPNKILLRRFMQLIRTHSSFKKSIEEYAHELNITQGQFIRICQTTIGKSPKDIVTDYFIREAQIALTNVDKSISEVAYELAIDDPSYFARLFKKKIGLTPKEFRQKQRM